MFVAKVNFGFPAPKAKSLDADERYLYVRVCVFIKFTVLP
jgi:hypothetical protein